jgi:hypothetical protein
MPIMVRDNKKAFTPAPEVLHQAVCVDVVDLGLVEGPWGAKPTVEPRWELDLTNEETGRPFLVSKRYTLTLAEKGTPGELGRLDPLPIFSGEGAWRLRHEVSRCQAENDAGPRFCEDCGARLEAACPSCGTPVTPGKKFCRSSGAALTSAPAGRFAKLGRAARA